MGAETPANGGFMVAAYLIVAGVTLLYAVVLWKRSR